MHCELLDSEAQWSKTLEQINKPDVYFSWGYHALHSSTVASPLAVLVRDGANALFIPGMKSQIPQASGAWDLQTPNGYGGPLSTSSCDSAFIEGAWATARTKLSQAGCVAAFFRLHPLLDNPLLPNDADKKFDRETIAVNLTGGIQSVLQRADGRHRNMVRKAEQSGAQVRTNEPNDWKDFIALYAEAMERLSATDSLRFLPAYFAALASLPECQLFSLRDGERLVAAATFLEGPAYSHYHLSARTPDAPNYATNWLIHAGIEHAVSKALRAMHLGGGRTPAADDALFKFKSSIGSERKQFSVARVIVNPDAFSNLENSWAKRTGRSPRWLLGYRETE